MDAHPGLRRCPGSGARPEPRDHALGVTLRSRRLPARAPRAVRSRGDRGCRGPGAHSAAAVPAAWPWAMQQTVLRVDMCASWSEVIIMPAASRLSRPADAQRPVGDAVGAAVPDLQARRVVVKAVGHHVVVEMPPLQHVGEGDVVVAGDQPRPPDVERRAGAGDEGLLAAGHVLAEQLDGSRLAPAQFQFGAAPPRRGRWG